MSNGIIGKIISDAPYFKRNCKTISFMGGTAVLINNMAAYWIKGDEAFAANGIAKMWSPWLEYSKNREICYANIAMAINARDRH